MSEGSSTAPAAVSRAASGLANEVAITEPPAIMVSEDTRSNQKIGESSSQQLFERKRMSIEQTTREALDIESLRPQLPTSIPVLDLSVEDYVDSTGEQSLRVFVIIDESTDVDNVPGRDVGELKSKIRNALREHGCTVFPYFVIAKPSELQEDTRD